MCECGHPEENHCHGIGRCDGESYDPEYGVFKCMCPALQPTKEGTSSETTQ
jgi:hypothetical protein